MAGLDVLCKLEVLPGQDEETVRRRDLSQLC